MWKNWRELSCDWLSAGDREGHFRQSFLLKAGLWRPFLLALCSQASSPISAMTAGIFYSCALHLFCVNNQQKLKRDEENLSYHCGSDTLEVGCWSIMYGWLARHIAQSMHTYLGAESKLKSSSICRWIKEHNSIPSLKAREEPISKCGWMVSAGWFQPLPAFCFGNLKEGKSVPGTSQDLCWDLGQEADTKVKPACNAHRIPKGRDFQTVRNSSCCLTVLSSTKRVFS